jgi:hypothetical protein
LQPIAAVAIIALVVFVAAWLWAPWAVLLPAVAWVVAADVTLMTGRLGSLGYHAMDAWAALAVVAAAVDLAGSPNVTLADPETLMPPT